MNYKQFIPKQIRNEIRQIRYHFGWLVQSIKEGSYHGVLNIMKVLLLRLWEDIKLIIFYNSENVKCELCDWQGNNFYPLTDRGTGYFIDELCPRCGSRSRHRTCWYYLRREITQSKSHLNKILEIGPMGGLRHAVETFTDLMYIGVDIKYISQLDIITDAQKLSFKNDVFDIVICFNVLSTVPDDVKAVEEMGRVCRSGGRIILSDAVDVSMECTVEWDSPRADKYNCIRWYGQDFVKRFSKPALIFREESFVFDISVETVHRYGLSKRLLFITDKSAD